MRIEELNPEQNISLLVNANGTSLTFDSQVLEVSLRKHFVLIDAIYQDGRPISFRGNGVVVNMLVYINTDTPHLFKNITINLVKRSDGTFCYDVRTPAASVIFNRRNNFRCYVGLPSAVQCGSNSPTHETIIRDVSYTGFAIVCGPSISFSQDQLLHVILNDRPIEYGETYIFHLYGLVTRIQELENGNTIYGCRLNSQVRGLEQYIMLKERIRMKNTNGGNL